MANALEAMGLPMSLAMFNTKLYMAWKGMEFDDRIFWSRFDGSNWAPQQSVPGIGTSSGVALGVFDGKLYMAWKGMASDQAIWWSSFDGSNWAAQQQVNGVGTSTVPGLACCTQEGRDKLRQSNRSHHQEKSAFLHFRVAFQHTQQYTSTDWVLFQY